MFCILSKNCKFLSFRINFNFCDIKRNKDFYCYYYFLNILILFAVAIKFNCHDLVNEYLTSSRENIGTKLI